MTTSPNENQLPTISRYVLQPYHLAQINSADSSAQVVGYWSIGDKQSYAVTYEKFKVQNGDTASRTMMTYEVDITVKDSTKKGYIVEWFYKNYKVDTDNAWEKSRKDNGAYKFGLMRKQCFLFCSSLLVHV